MFLHKKFVGQGQERAEVAAGLAATSAGVPTQGGAQVT